MINIHFTIQEEESGFVRVKGGSDDKEPTNKEVELAKKMLMAMTDAKNMKGWTNKETIVPLTIIETRKKKRQ